MAKKSKIISKNIKNKKEIAPETNNLIASTNIIFGILVAILLLTIITGISDGSYSFDHKPSIISTKEIIAGETFNRSENSYYVAFYDFASTSENLSTAIDGLTNTKIYRVDLGNGFNKSVISPTSNKTAQSASDLKIAGVTLIKIDNGINTEYMEDYETINNYIKTLS